MKTKVCANVPKATPAAIYLYVILFTYLRQKSYFLYSLGRRGPDNLALEIE